MKNSNGFTLVEMLGVIVLLGLLGIIAVTSTSKYLVSSRDKSFSIMSQSIYEATQNCQVQGKCTSDNTYYAGNYGGTSHDQNSDLIKMGYLNELKSPSSSKSKCTAKVVISTVSKIKANKKFKYKVHLNCPGMYNNQEKINIWPKEYSLVNDSTISFKIKDVANLSAMYKHFTIQITSGKDDPIDLYAQGNISVYINSRSLDSCNGLVQISGIGGNGSSIDLKYQMQPNQGNNITCSGEVKVVVPKGYAKTKSGVSSEETTLIVGTIPY